MNRQPGPLPTLAAEYAERALPSTQGTVELLSDAAIRAFQQLHAHVRTVFGPTGSDVLFRRALSRAATQHTILEKVGTPDTPEDLMAALREHVLPENSAQGTHVVRSVIAEEVSLIIRFIGEDLAQTILQIDHDERANRAEGEASADE